MFHTSPLRWSLWEYHHLGLAISRTIAPEVTRTDWKLFWCGIAMCMAVPAGKMKRNLLDPTQLLWRGKLILYSLFKCPCWLPRFFAHIYEQVAGPRSLQCLVFENHHRQTPCHAGKTTAMALTQRRTPNHRGVPFLEKVFLYFGFPVFPLFDCAQATWKARGLWL